MALLAGRLTVVVYELPVRDTFDDTGVTISTPLAYTLGVFDKLCSAGVTKSSVGNLTPFCSTTTCESLLMRSKLLIAPSFTM